jgi:cytochrome c biogenesis protein CcmG, thiol:disulfide interchange protein DsbE
VTPLAPWCARRAARRAWLTAAATLLAFACGRGDRSDEAFRPLAVGEQVPPYRATTLAGDTVRVNAGQPVTLVNVWATWCTSCREEMQDLEAMQRDFAPRGLRILAVSVDNGNGVRVRRFVESERLTFPVAHDPEGRVQQLYQTVGVPESYLIGRDGKLLWRQAGGLHGHTAEARASVERALGG